MEQIKTIKRLNNFIKKSPWCERQVFDEIAQAVKDLFKECRDAQDVADHYRYLGNNSKYKAILNQNEILFSRLDLIIDSAEWEVKDIIKNVSKKDSNYIYLFN